MKDNLRFLKVTKPNIDDLSQGISDLYFLVHKRKLDPEYWQWRYLNSPAGKSNLIVAVRGARVVGQYGTLYMRLIVDGQLVVAGLMGGLCVDPVERSWYCYRGLVETNRVETYKDKLAFCFGIAPARLMELIKRMNVISLGCMPVCFGFLNIVHILEGRDIPYPLSLIGHLIQPVLGLCIRSKEALDFEIRSVESFDSEFDQLWQDVAQKRIVRIIKNAAFLNWRYVECPMPNYICLAAYRNKRLEGFAVFCSTGLRNGARILEILVRDDNPEIMKALLVKALQQLRLKKIGCITASFAKDSPEAAVLKKLGFKFWDIKSEPTHILITVKDLKETSLTLELRNWNLSLGDWEEH